MQVDAWRELGEGAGTAFAGDEAQRVSNDTHLKRRSTARSVLDAAIRLGYAKSGDQCADRTDVCVDQFPPECQAGVEISTRSPFGLIFAVLDCERRLLHGRGTAHANEFSLQVL